MKTLRRTVSDGVQTLYNVDFELGYFEREHIFVYAGTDNSLYETQLSYVWQNDTQIELLVPAEYVSGTIINIRRVVPRDTLYVEFKNSTGITELSLNSANAQALMLIEEIDDGFTPTGYFEKQDMSFDNLYTVVNLRDGVDGQDAVTMKQLFDMDEGYFGVIAAEVQADADRAEDAANSINSDNFVAQDSKTGAANIPLGTIAQRPATAQEGMFRRNSETKEFEGYTGDEWSAIGGGGGLVWSQAPSNSEIGVAGEGLLFDTSTVVSTFTLPATPSEGDSVGVGDGSGNAGVHKITVTSADTIMGLSEDFYLDSDNQSFIFSYINSNWVVTGGMSSLGVGDIVTMNDTGLYPLAGNAYVTDNMYGLNYRETGDHTISVDAGNCMDSLNITPLVASALQTVTIPSVINEVYNLFLCDDGVVRTDTDVNGATLLAGSVSKLRWIGFVKTNASGIITRFTMVDDVLFFETFSEVTFLTGISTTMLTVDESSIVPVSRIKQITYGGESNTDDAVLQLGDMVNYNRFGYIRTNHTQSDTTYPWAGGTGTNTQNDMQPIGQVKSVNINVGIGKIAVRGVTMRR